MTRQRVSYFYDNDVGNYQYAGKLSAFLFSVRRADGTDFRIGKSPHPMKPHRMRMVHDLILNYNMHKKLDMCVSPLVLTMFCRQPNWGV